jgi:L,D-transpeptidase YcbB
MVKICLQKSFCEKIDMSPKAPFFEKQVLRRISYANVFSRLGLAFMLGLSTDLAFAQENQRRIRPIVETTGSVTLPDQSYQKRAAVLPMLEVNARGDSVIDLREKPASASTTTATIGTSHEEGPFRPARPRFGVSTTPPQAAPADGIPLPDAAPVDLTLDPSLVKPLTGLAAVVFERASLSDWSRVARLKPAQREEITAFYAARRYEPIWIHNEAWTAQARQVMHAFERADADGLTPTDYTAPVISPLPTQDKLKTLADAELRLSALALMYANDARGGRLEPSRLSAMMTPTLEIPKAMNLLSALAQSAQASDYLESYHPPHEGYRRLKHKLAQLRSSRPTLPMVRVPQGPVVRLGMKDARVTLIRTRFGLPLLDQPETDHIYDERVAMVVSTFQKEKGLAPTGILTRATVEALSGDSLSRQESDLLANMERWRWLPQNMGERHIFVNIPEYKLRVFAQGEMIHQTKVIIGKPETPTPVFSDKMEHLIVNPSWYVPPSILKKEFLPKLAEDAGYAERRGFEVLRNKQGQAVGVRQPPGERNALGNIKFIFPNNHAVYLHDTPTRHLFGSEKRAFSHGCVRVDKPFALAEVIMGGTQKGWAEKRLRGMVGSGERHIKVDPQLPVHLSYFTMSVDENGEVTRFEDLYGYHRRVREALERVRGS